MNNHIPRSILKPTVVKKNPNKSPLKGAMSASIWYLYFVSARSNPARNAPRVFESPIPSQSKRKEQSWKKFVCCQIASMDYALICAEKMYKADHS